MEATDLLTYAIEFSEEQVSAIMKQHIREVLALEIVEQPKIICKSTTSFYSKQYIPTDEKFLVYSVVKKNK